MRMPKLILSITLVAVLLTACGGTNKAVLPNNIKLWHDNSLRLSDIDAIVEKYGMESLSNTVAYYRSPLDGSAGEFIVEGFSFDGFTLSIGTMRSILPGEADKINNILAMYSTTSEALEQDFTTLANALTKRYGQPEISDASAPGTQYTWQIHENLMARLFTTSDLSEPEGSFSLDFSWHLTTEQYQKLYG